MTKQLRTLAAFPQDLGSILRRNTVAQSNLYISFPKASDPFFWPLRETGHEKHPYM